MIHPLEVYEEDLTLFDELSLPDTKTYARWVELSYGRWHGYEIRNRYHLLLACGYNHDSLSEQLETERKARECLPLPVDFVPEETHDHEHVNHLCDMQTPVQDMSIIGDAPVIHIESASPGSVLLAPPPAPAVAAADTSVLYPADTSVVYQDECSVLAVPCAPHSPLSSPIASSPMESSPASPSPRAYHRPGAALPIFASSAISYYSPSPPPPGNIVLDQRSPSPPAAVRLSASERLAELAQLQSAQLKRTREAGNAALARAAARLLDSALSLKDVPRTSLAPLHRACRIITRVLGCTGCDHKEADDHDFAACVCTALPVITQKLHGDTSAPSLGVANAQTALQAGNAFAQAVWEYVNLIIRLQKRHENERNTLCERLGVKN